MANRRWRSLSITVANQMADVMPIDVVTHAAVRMHLVNVPIIQRPMMEPMVIMTINISRRVPIDIGSIIGWLIIIRLLVIGLVIGLRKKLKERKSKTTFVVFVILIPTPAYHLNAGG